MAIVVPQKKQSTPNQGLGQFLQVGGAVAGGLMGGIPGAMTGASLGGMVGGAVTPQAQAPQQSAQLAQQSRNPAQVIQGNPNAMQLQKSIQALSIQPPEFTQQFEQPLIAAFNQSLSQGGVA